MIWENGHMKINLSGKSKSLNLNASVNNNLQMKHEAHTVWNGNNLHTLGEANECWLPLQESNAVTMKGQEFSHFTHSITLHFINKAPGHNSHIFTMLRLEDRLEIQAAYLL